MMDTESVTHHQWDNYAKRLEKKNLREFGTSPTFTTISRKVNKFTVDIREEGIIVHKGWRQAMKQAAQRSKTMIYIMGYSGRTLAQLKQIAEEKDATIFDIRFSPRSRNPQFSGKRMAEELGDRYMHVRQLGNRNYKGGPVALVDYEAGKQMILNHRRNVILVCVCRDHVTCHRTDIARKLRAEGHQVEEIPLPGAKKPRTPGLTQLTLF